MKRIGERRHARALRKELHFWRRRGVLRDQALRVRRYDPFLMESMRIGGLTAGGEVLDVGCGPTCCAMVIPSARKWYLDPLLDEYRKICELPEGEYLAAAIEEAALPDGFFDLAICLNALDHLRDPWKALEVLHRVLKPDGILLCSVYTRRSLLAALRNLQEYLGLSTDVAHPYSFTTDTLSRQLRLAGFVFDPPRIVHADRERAEMIWCCRKPAGQPAPVAGPSD
jgi:ubiquinone/menaquinone biosynthesis C-methylase UbiE